MKNEEGKEGRDAFKRRREAMPLRLGAFHCRVQLLKKNNTFLSLWSMAISCMDQTIFEQDFASSPFPNHNNLLPGMLINFTKFLRKKNSTHSEIFSKKRNVSCRGQREGPRRRSKKNSELDEIVLVFLRCSGNLTKADYLFFFIEANTG